jgi:hypothetical protein
MPVQWRQAQPHEDGGPYTQRQLIWGWVILILLVVSKEDLAKAALNEHPLLGDLQPARCRAQHFVNNLAVSAMLS